MTCHAIRLFEFDDFEVYWRVYSISNIVFWSIMFCLFSWVWLTLRKKKMKNGFYKVLSLCMAIYNLAAILLYLSARLIDIFDDEVHGAGAFYIALGVIWTFC
jgi:hypothetical protein